MVPIAFGMLACKHLSGYHGGSGRYDEWCRRTSLVLLSTLMSWTILPSLIFMGVGAQTDFAPLIANPITFLLGHLHSLVFLPHTSLAILMGFNGAAAAEISIIGGADGRTIHLPLQQAWSDSSAWPDRCCDIFLHVSGSDHSAANYEVQLRHTKREYYKNPHLRPYLSLRKFSSQSSLLL